MHKVFSIHIASQVFHTNEAAFEMLSKYLMTLKSMYGDGEQAKEMMQEIEIRVAKIILEENNNSYLKIIDTTLVSKVIEEIGYPKKQKPENNPSQKLSRDTDHKIIAGVCSGLSNFLNIEDPIWIRLLFVAFMIAGLGSSLIVYIALWALLPVKKNSPPIAPDVISSDDPRNTLEGNKRFTTSIDDDRNASTAQQNLPHVLSTFAKIIKTLLKVAAIIFIVFFGFLVTLLVLILFTFGVGSLSLAPSLPQFIYENSFIAHATITSFVVLMVITMVSFVLLLLQIFSSSKKVLTKTSVGLLGFIWLSALFIFILGAANGVKQFKTEEKVITENVIDGSLLGDTLFIRGNNKYKNEEESNSSLNITWNDLNIINDNIFNAMVKLNIAQSPDQNIHIFKEVSSKGSNKENALKYIEAVDYQYVILKDTLTFNNYLSQNKEPSKFRLQKVELTIYLPEGKPFILKDVEHMIYKKPRIVGEFGHYDLEDNIWTIEKGFLVPMATDTSTVQQEDAPMDII